MATIVQRPSLRSRSVFSLCWHLSVWGGLGIIVAAAATISLTDVVKPQALIALVVLAIITELRPVVVAGKDANGIVVSYAFVFAIMYVYGLPAAVLTLALATLLSELYERRTAWKVFFNIGQHSLCLGVTWIVMVISRHTPSLQDPTVTFNADDVLWMPTTWAVFFLVNHLLIVGVSADTSMTFKEALREDLSYYILTLFAVLSLAPIIALVAVTVWPMLFLFLVPLWAVNKAASISQERDYASRHDMLTELPNRTMMRDELTEAIDLASRTGARVGVLLMDLNLFKEVNDTYGHAVGDRLLTMVAGRIKAQVRPGDLAARLGGDEFAVVLPGVEDHISAVRIAQRIRESISRPFTMDDVTVTIDVSIGIALYPDDGTHIDPLIQAADSAMYVAKRTGTRIEVVGIDRGEARG